MFSLKKDCWPQNEVKGPTCPIMSYNKRVRLDDPMVPLTQFWLICYSLLPVFKQKNQVMHLEVVLFFITSIFLNQMNIFKKKKK